MRFSLIESPPIKTLTGSRRARRWAALWSAALLLLGCAAGEENTDHSAVSCTTPADCPEGMVCTIERSLGAGTWCVTDATTDTSEPDGIDTADDTTDSASPDSDIPPTDIPDSDLIDPDTDPPDTQDTDPPDTQDTADTADTSDTSDTSEVGLDCTGAPNVAGFRCVPAGTFMMGSPPAELGRGIDEALHEVEITRPFLMKRSEVTQADWQALMGGNNPSGNVACGADCPVDQVTWLDALAFANAMSTRDGLQTCYDLSTCSGVAGVDLACPSDTVVSFVLICTGYRLPTEAEWELAARSGTETAFYNGDISVTQGSDSKLNLIAWYKQNALSLTHPNSSKGANVYGLYDMSGNVYEWVWDYYSSAYYDVWVSNKASNPRGPSTGTERSARGGSYVSEPVACRSAARASFDPTGRFSNVGFRVVRSLP